VIEVEVEQVGRVCWVPARVCPGTWCTDGSFQAAIRGADPFKDWFSWDQEGTDWRRVPGTKSFVITPASPGGAAVLHSQSKLAPRAQSKTAPRLQSKRAPRPQSKGTPRAGQVTSRATAVGAADRRPLNAANAKGRLVLIPAEMWPDFACEENGGAGCSASVYNRSRSRTCTCTCTCTLNSPDLRPRLQVERHCAARRQKLRYRALRSRPDCGRSVLRGRNRRARGTAATPHQGFRRGARQRAQRRGTTCEAAEALLVLRLLLCRRRRRRRRRLRRRAACEGRQAAEAAAGRGWPRSWVGAGPQRRRIFARGGGGGDGGGGCNAATNSGGAVRGQRLPALLGAPWCVRHRAQGSGADATAEAGAAGSGRRCGRRRRGQRGGGCGGAIQEGQGEHRGHGAASVHAWAPWHCRARYRCRAREADGAPDGAARPSDRHVERRRLVSAAARPPPGLSKRAWLRAAPHA
jgi:hypothetical protein